MNQSSQAFALLGLAVTALGLLAGGAAHKASQSRRKAASQERGLQVDLSGPEPISIVCLKKPVPILTVYQY